MIKNHNADNDQTIIKITNKKIIIIVIFADLLLVFFAQKPRSIKMVGPFGL